MTASPTHLSPAPDPLMRLVVEYGISDGFTYHCTVTQPAQYASAEAFVVEFEELCKQQLGGEPFKFAGLTFRAENFFEEGQYFGPTVMTVDEWFARGR